MIDIDKAGFKEEFERNLVMIENDILVLKEMVSYKDKALEIIKNKEMLNRKEEWNKLIEKFDDLENKLKAVEILM